MMIPTSQNLRQERERFTRLVQGALGPLVRIRLDAEGWPYCPARHGRLEWRGIEVDGASRLYAYTDRPRMIRPLLAIAGVHRVQIGDTEAAVWVPGPDRGAIQAVAALLRVRTRRAPETAPATGRFRPREPGSRAVQAPDLASDAPGQGQEPSP